MIAKSENILILMLEPLPNDYFASQRRQIESP